MTTHAFTPHEAPPARRDETEPIPGRALVPIARAFYAAIFLLAGPSHFARGTIDMAAAHGVPMAQFLVPAAGVVALAGGLSVLFGYRARAGAWLLILFLVPVTVVMHDFWNVADPAGARLQFVMFMKNLSMLGAAMLLAHFGPGPVSIDRAHPHH